jgi:NADP-dependent 3-hydroxy acid dehydrogenase YdfG
MSVIYGLNLFVDEMIASQERCHIINTSSMAGIIVGPALLLIQPPSMQL